MGRNTSKIPVQSDKSGQKNWMICYINNMGIIVHPVNDLIADPTILFTRFRTNIAVHLTLFVKKFVACEEVTQSQQPQISKLNTLQLPNTLKLNNELSSYKSNKIKISAYELV